MRVLALILDGPLTDERIAAAVAGAASRAGSVADAEDVGARLRFEGVVRRMEPCGGEMCPLLALEYHTYDPMAERELQSLGRDVLERHGLSSITALHSRGRVGVGEVSFVLEVTAPHRAEAIAAVAEFIERLKRDVPIWKLPVWAS